MHLYRWLTSIVAVPLLVTLLYFHHRWVFYTVVLAASVKGLLEWIRMTTPELPSALKVFGVLLNVLLFHFFAGGPFSHTLFILCLWVMGPLGFFLFSSQDRRQQAADAVGKMTLGFLYICLPLGLLIVMDRHPRGNLWILFLLTVIFLGDTGAFYLGRAFGKKKLHPSVSPNKTWAGAIGGFFSSIAAGLVFSYVFRLGGFPWQAAALSGGLSVCGQIGDLVESMIKRNAGVKDSGRILPGHGGMLDRVDALLFAIPLLYLYLSGFGL